MTAWRQIKHFLSTHNSNEKLLKNTGNAVIGRRNSLDFLPLLTANFRLIIFYKNCQIYTHWYGTKNLLDFWQSNAEILLLKIIQGNLNMTGKTVINRSEYNTFIQVYIININMHGHTTATISALSRDIINKQDGSFPHYAVLKCWGQEKSINNGGVRSSIYVKPGKLSSVFYGASCNVDEYLPV